MKKFTSQEIKEFGSNPSFDEKVLLNKDSSWPKISIVTPSYNQGKFIERTILSVINQNYPNLEYFIIDGGSNDDTTEIIRKYEKYIDWWVSEKDKGQGDAIRKGFERATGELIGWLNSDDMYFPGALIEIAKAYLKNPSASIYTGGIAIGALNDGPIKKCRFPSKWLIFRKHGLFSIGQQSSFFNREYYEKIGGINTKFFHRMDADIIRRLIRYNPSIIRVNKMVGFIRFHEEAKSATARELYLKEKKEFIKSIGLTPLKYEFMVYLYRLIRLLTWDYLTSWNATIKCRGRRIEEIWRKYLTDKKFDNNLEW